jgi:hypothetical protein
MAPVTSAALAAGGSPPHNAPMLQPRHAPLLSILALAAVSSCQSSGGLPPVEGIRSASDARPGLLASVSVAPLDRITGDVDGLSRGLGLPFAGKDLLTMLFAQHQLDAAAAANIDTAQPLGLAIVAPASKDGQPLEAMVLSARGADGAARLLAALGTAAEKQRGAQKITRADGTVIWTAAQGARIFASSSLDGLVAAGALAREAQRASSNDVVVTMFPDAFARWRGTDVRTALASFRKELIDEQLTAAQRRGAPVPGPAERLMYETAIDLFLDPLGDSAAGAFTLDLDAQKGIRFGLRLEPRPGSAFGKRIAAPTPYAVDPALFGAGGADPIAGLWALGPSPFWLEVYDRVFQAQAKAGLRGAAEVSRRYQAVRPFLSGAGSGAIRLHNGALANDAVVGLRAPSTAVLDAVAALASSRGFTELLGEIYGKATPQVNARRERDTLRTELAFPVRDRPGDPGTALRVLLGSPTLATVATVSGGRLLLATEPAAAGRLAALASPHPQAAPPDLATALEETRGQDGFLYLETWSLMKPGLALAASPQEAQMIRMVTMMPGFAQLKLPVVMSYRGGAALTAELRIPLSTLTNAANVARPFLGGARP